MRGEAVVQVRIGEVGEAVVEESSQGAVMEQVVLNPEV